MAHRPPTRRALQDLVRHCHSGLDAPDLERSLLRAVRRLVPAEAAFFATADPQSLLFTGGFAEEPLDAVTPLFLANEFGTEDVNKFASLATSPGHVASLDSATTGDRFASKRYRDIMRPLGLGDELRVALVAGSRCWGYLCLHRADRSTGFTDSEQGLIAAAAPHLGHALRQALLLGGTTASGRTRQPGVVVLTDDLNLVAATAPASEYVAQMKPAPGLALPTCIYTCAALLRSIEAGTAAAGALPMTRVRTRTGQWLTVHASRLSGPSGEHGITVVIEQADATDVMPLRLAVYGLSPREVEVATLVVRGSSTRVISTALHISEHTVQDHLKAVFDKAGVRSRRELIGAMLS